MSELPAAVGNAEKNKATTSVTSKLMSPFLALPSPADNVIYTNIEVIDLVITHNKKDVVQLIHASKYRPKQSALYQLLSKKKVFDK